MAIYSTFCLCKPEELLDGFPGWRLPLPEPVQRQRMNPFTKKVVTIQTREPEWTDEETAEAFESAAPIVVAIKGSFEQYLEGRLRPFVRARPHWCAKGLTNVELVPRVRASGHDTNLECPLYCPPGRDGGVLMQFPPDFVSTMALLDDGAAEGIAARWAAAMSTPTHTHSATGNKLNDGWSPADAMRILRPLGALTAKREGDAGMYLLIEA